MKVEAFANPRIYAAQVVFGYRRFGTTCPVQVIIPLKPGDYVTQGVTLKNSVFFHIPYVLVSYDCRST
jgi:hypothetical protein